MIVIAQGILQLNPIFLASDRVAAHPEITSIAMIRYRRLVNGYNDRNRMIQLSVTYHNVADRLNFES